MLKMAVRSFGGFLAPDVSQPADGAVKYVGGAGFLHDPLVGAAAGALGDLGTVELFL